VTDPPVPQWQGGFNALRREAVSCQDLRSALREAEALRLIKPYAMLEASGRVSVRKREPAARAS